MSKLLILLLTALSVSVGHPQPAQSAHSEDKLLKELVQTICPVLANNLFKHDRSLAEYGEYLSHNPQSDFKTRVEHLPPGSVYIDMGAGDALALREIQNNLKLVAVNYKNPPMLDALLARQAIPHIEVLHGDYLENMYQHGRLDHLNGKVDLITDIGGVLSYTEHFSEVFKIYSKLLKTGGDMEFAMILKNREGEKVFFTKNGSDEELFPKSVYRIDSALRYYLKQFKGLEVSHARFFNNNWSELVFAAQLKKTQDTVIIPDLSLQMADRKAVPPVRSWRFQSPGFDSPRLQEYDAWKR